MIIVKAQVDQPLMRLCCVQVKQGSVADLAGHLLPGDEVLEWAGTSLRGRTYEDVRDIIAASRQERSIELVVSRDTRLGPGLHTWPDQPPGTGRAPGDILSSDEAAVVMLRSSAAPRPNCNYNN